MIDYAIAAARRSGLFERIVVSTDDDEIAAVARAAGAEVPFLRPAELADDHCATLPVVAHAIDACGATGEVCCIYPAVPLLDPADLAAGLDLLRSRAAPFVFPVTAFPSPPQHALRRLPDGRLEPMFREHLDRRSQDLEPAYFDAGQFYWGTAESWRSGLSIHANGVGLVIPSWRVVDIDTADDWAKAEALHAVLEAKGLGGN